MPRKNKNAAQPPKPRAVPKPEPKETAAQVDVSRVSRVRSTGRGGRGR